MLKVQFPEASVLTLKIWNTTDLRDSLELPLLGLLTKSKQSRNPGCNCSAVVIWDKEMIWHRGKEGPVTRKCWKVGPGSVRDKTHLAREWSFTPWQRGEMQPQHCPVGIQEQELAGAQAQWPPLCNRAGLGDAPPAGLTCSWSCSWDWCWCKCIQGRSLWLVFADSMQKHVLWWDFKQALFMNHFLLDLSTNMFRFPWGVP